jgi:signal transduction histidine kinase
MTPAVIIAFAFFIVLLAGAGWKRGNPDVHFTSFDKIWLDFSLFALILYESAVCYYASYLFRIVWRYRNFTWINILCALFAAFFLLPLLWWFTCLAKRCKAGNFWRHTLLYCIVRGTVIWLVRAFNSLWAGIALTARVAAIGTALFISMALGSILHPTRLALAISLLISVIATLGMLRYANKLNKVERGAKAASGVSRETIAVTGGELGSIAASINSISDGIYDAVYERMKSDRLKTELITNISHDIRTPLTSLITYTDLLKNEGLDNARAPEYLDILIQKSARLKNLTDDLFEASKAASGNIDVHLDDIDLADFVRQYFGESDEKVRSSGLDFRLNLPEHAKVRADGKLLWRIADNLLTNAMNYSLSGSRVYVDIVAEIVAENEFFRLDIKNISSNPLNVEPAELFERFKRGDESRTGDGSGLGLSIAQSFAQAQGGQLVVSIDGDLFKASMHLRGA